MITDSATSNNPNKALWEKGDFTRIAASMRESAEALVDQLRDQRRPRGAGPRMRRRNHRAAGGETGANVLGVDIASNLVEAGNARARALGIANCRFQQGDATDLYELEDDQFDLVVSMFGAMFAPRPFDVANGSSVSRGPAVES